MLQNPLWIIDPISAIMAATIVLLGVNIAKFSYHYLSGDNHRFRFWRFYALLMASLLVWVFSNQLLLMLISWTLANYSLVQLMRHKDQWTAANESAKLTAKYLFLSCVFLASGLLVLAYSTGEHTLSGILDNASQRNLTTSIAMTLIIISVVIQSALWPAHKWLLSSLNSPTPVSAIMHAGLINGGGFILIRFSPLILSNSTLLQALFLLALVSTVLATLWKLIAHDVKKMLACSTMAQMGFMLMQCGCGLFSAAIGHLVWHSFFKAYLFLSSGNTLKQTHTPKIAPQMNQTLLALISGAIGSFIFALISNKALLPTDTSWILVLIAGLMLTQISLSILKQVTLLNVVLSVLASAMVGGLYGLNIWLIEQFVAPLNLYHAQPMSVIYWFGAIVILLSWAFTTFFIPKTQQDFSPRLIKWYVRLLNTSQPHPNTITASRQQYHF